jgi:hypothetical protein
MDQSESHVRDYLEHLNLGRVAYQPDGNIPPDFLVDGRIAVEVRRLNENELTESGAFRGLETDRISTGHKFHALLHSLGPAKSHTSWFVGCKVKRPIPRWKDIEDDLRRELEDFRDHEERQRLCVLRIAAGFEVHIIHRASDPHPTCFIFAGCNDRDVGGFVFGDIQCNLRLCVEDKMRRIARVRNKYPEWWLVFVDHIGFGVDSCDQESYRQQLDIEHDLDRLILLSPLDKTRAFEVPRKVPKCQALAAPLPPADAAN